MTRPGDHDLTRDDYAAALAARRELGPDYDEAIAASLAERVERMVQSRVRADLTPRPEPKPDRTPFALAMGSLVFGVPITAISAGVSGLPGLIVSWGGIALVNAAYALTSRPRHPGRPDYR